MGAQPYELRGAAHPVPPFRLCLVQGFVCCFQQSFRQLARRWIGCRNPATDRSPDTDVVRTLGWVESREAREFHHLPQTFCNLHCGSFWGRRQKDNELLAAKPRRVIVLYAKRLLQQ